METKGLTLNRKEIPVTLRGAREKASQVPYHTTQSNFSSSMHSTAFQLLSHSEPSIKPLQCASWLNTGFRLRSYLSPSPAKWKGCPLRIRGWMLPSYQVSQWENAYLPFKDRKPPTWTTNIFTCWNGNSKSQGLFPETKCGILLSAVKIIFVCHLAVTCCQRLGDWERPQFIILQTEMMVKEDGGHRGPGTEQCLLAPYVLTAHLSLLLRPSDPECLGCRFWGLGLALD